MQTKQLNWWPLLRDTCVYLVSVAVLMWVGGTLLVMIYSLQALRDGRVSWRESLIMIVMYAGYIVMMK